jgi:hypothetical protein
MGDAGTIVAAQHEYGYYEDHAQTLPENGVSKQPEEKGQYTDTNA